MLLHAEHLVKKYKTRTVVNDMSVRVEQGEIVGLLGPNGAGKTTCFYMMVGLVKPNSGTIWVDDEDITRLPMFERARRGLGRALATDPKFVLLDEPFAGVDPIATEEIQGIVARLKDKNIGILITDHDVQATLNIVDRAYLLFEGKLLRAGTAEELAEDPVVREKYLGRFFEFKRRVY
mgnify:CR=1 FL=1